MDLAAELGRLRAAGAAQHDPVRWHFIEVLARRVAGCDGALRDRLTTRLATLLTQFDTAVRAREHGRHGPAVVGAGSSGEPVPETPRDPAPQRPLAALLQHISTHAAPAAELQTLRRFRRTWSRLAADQRVVRSRTRLPDNAGPLNSQRLVHRALTLMRELSPDYLEHFVAHADALLWLERAGGGDLLAKKDVLVQPGTAPRKTRRSR